MKKTILKIVSTMLLLLALGTSSAVADTVPAPGCYPRPCPLCNKVVHGEWLV